MPAVASMQCPHCKRDITIKNPALIGKKVKCPGCDKAFVVAVPAAVEDDEVPLRLAQDDLPVGTAPRLVTSSPLPPPVLNPTAAPTFPPLESALLPPVVNPRGASQPSVPPVAPALEVPTLNVQPTAVFNPLLPVAGQGAGLNLAPPVASASAELDRLRRRGKKATWLWAIIGLLAAGLLGGVGYYVSQQPQKLAASAGEEPTASADPQPMNAVRGDGPYSKRELEISSEYIREFQPTHGEPISLRMLPDGVNFIIHLRPALMWSDEFDYQVLRAALTEDVTNWLAAKMEEVTKHKPEQIEELTFGIFLGARGMEPEISAVVRLKEPGKLSELTALYPGNLAVELPPPLIKIDDKTAFWIHDDLKTIVIWPSAIAGNGALQDSANVSASVLPKVEELLRNTDREHLITIIGNPTDLSIAAPQIFPEAARQPLGFLVDWFGPDTEFASWTLHPTPYLYSQMALCPVSTSNTSKLKTQFESQLTELPHVMMYDVVRKMQPREMRVRNFVSRYPAMLEAFRQSTVLQNTPEQVTLTTVLPANATPNLALATLFTVSEAQHTNFNAVVATAPTVVAEKLPDTVVARMKELTLDAEFERKPIEEAIVYICGEIKVKVFVDGDAFKDAGWTKNMPQTFNLGKVTGERALAEIINKYNEKLSQMVISIDESKMQIHVTTRKFAERDNLTTYEFPKFE